MLTNPYSTTLCILTRTRVLLAWARWGCAPGAPCSLDPLLCALAPAPDVPFVQTPAPGPALRGLCLIPSSRRTRRMLLGSSSTAHSTSVRHSGQRNSPREPKMPWRQRRQKVCWQGRTFAEASSRSRQTGHSSKSKSTDSSILCLFCLYFSRKNMVLIRILFGSRISTITSLPCLGYGHGVCIICKGGVRYANCSAVNTRKQVTVFTQQTAHMAEDVMQWCFICWACRWKQLSITEFCLLQSNSTCNAVA